MSKTVKWIIAIIVIVLIVVGVWYFAKSDNSPAVSPIASSTEPIKIGAILPLTGTNARYGEMEKNGLEMALAEINNKDGINGKKLEISYEDSAGQAKQAVDAWTKMIMDKGINLIIAGMSGPCQVLSPRANQNHIVLMSSDCAVASYSSPDDYTFRINSSNKREAEQMAQLLISRNVKSVSILKVNNDYAKGLFDFFSPAYSQLGGKINITESYQPDQRDFRSELDKITYSKPQALFLMSYAPDAEAILRQIKELKISLPLYAGEPIENSAFLKNMGSNADGIIYLKATLSASVGQLFQLAYEKKFGNKPEVNPARAYDALNIISQVINSCDKAGTPNADCLKNGLYTIKNYVGTTGNITFDKNGDADIPYVAKTIKNGQFVPLNP